MSFASSSFRGAPRGPRRGLRHIPLLAALALGLAGVFAPGAAGAQEASATAEQDPQAPSAEEILASSVEKSLSVESWTADIKASMSMMAMEITGEIAFKGGRFRTEMDMNIMGQPTSILVVGDQSGTVWTESNIMGTKMIMKYEAEQMEAMGGQFGGGMPGMGNGMFSQNPAETLSGFGDMYDLTLEGSGEASGVAVWRLTGRIKSDMTAPVDTVDPTGELASMGFSMDTISIEIGKDDGMMRSMKLGPSNGEPFMSRVYENVRINPEIDDAMFQYTPPEGAHVMDLGEMMSGGALAEGLAELGAPGSGVNLDTLDIEVEPGLAAGDAAPQFEAPLLGGGTIELADLRGKVVLLDFWASWSEPWKRELGARIALHEKHAETGLVIIGVSLENSRDAVEAFLAEHAGMAWPQIFDAKGWNTPVAVAYGANFAPYTVLIDREGNVAAVELEGDALASAVGELFED